jgi:hypothetical protein
MRFLITMHMPTRQPDNGMSANLVHQMNVEHRDSQSLQDFVGALSGRDFVIVEEFYRDPQTGAYYSRGHVAINSMHIGKIKVLDSPNQRS